MARKTIVALPDDLTIADLDRAFANDYTISSAGKRGGLYQMHFDAVLLQSKPGGPYRIRISTVIGTNGDVDTVKLQPTRDGRSLIVKSIDWGDRAFFVIFFTVTVIALLLAVVLASPLDDGNWSGAGISAACALFFGIITWFLARVAAKSRAFNRRLYVDAVFRYAHLLNGKI